MNRIISSRWLAVLGVACGALVLCALAFRKHAALHSHGSDLGIFVNLIWNLVRHGSWHSGMLERHFFGEHFSPMLALLAPLYRLWPDARLLLAVQSAALALGAWPLYKLARARLGPGAALAVLFAYFVYPPLLGVALHDFHEVALAVPLLAFALWWLDRGRLLPAVLALAAAVLCKEELALTAAMVGVYQGIVRRDWKLGGALFAAGFAAFLLLTGAVMPAWRGGPLPFADRYSHLADSLGGLAALAVRNPLALAAACVSPDKARYLLDLLRPLGFLPLLAPLEWIPALPTLARNLLSNHEPQFSVHFHYPAPMIPFVFAALIGGLARLRERLRRFTPLQHRQGIALWAAPAILLLAAFFWGSPLLRRWQRYRPAPRTAAFHELRAMIPPDTSVSAHNRLVPHVANRADICTFPVVRDADFLLLDFGYPYFEYPVHDETHRQRFLHALDAEGYRIAAVREKFVLARRAPDDPAEPDPGILEELFFRHGRRNLQKTAARRDAYWQGPRGYLPPGRWRVEVVLEPRAAAARGGDPLALGIHPYMGGKTGEWALGDVQSFDPAGAGLAPGEPVTLSWTFDQPRRQILSLRIVGDPKERRHRLVSIAWHPADPPQALAALRLPPLSTAAGDPP